jgi:RnfABCDGE-type electron transport complex D subunit
MSTQLIMLIVVISLLPACGFGVYNFGLRALFVLLFSVASCVLSEYVFNLITKRPNSISDLSAVVTGLLLGMNLPSSVPYFVPVLGGFFAIIVVKMLFGGLGQNFMNPALGARCFLVLSFAGPMNKFFPDGVSGVDAVTSATPLTQIKQTGETATSLFDMFIGRHAGTIGETSICALLIGAIFLLVTKIIDLRIPLTYIVTFAIFMMLFNKSTDMTYLAKEICGGGLVFGAFFMATDYSTSPITKNGKIVYGICLGLLTAILRTFGSTAEGVSFAIIICNLLVPMIEKITFPKAFGIVKKSSKESK